MVRETLRGKPASSPSASMFLRARNDFACTTRDVALGWKTKDTYMYTYNKGCIHQNKVSVQEDFD